MRVAIAASSLTHYVQAAAVCVVAFLRFRYALNIPIVSNFCPSTFAESAPIHSSITVAYTLSEVGGVLEVAVEDEVGEARRRTVHAALHGVADHEVHLGGAMVGSKARVLRHASAELAVHVDDDVVRSSDPLHLLEEARRWRPSRYCSWRSCGAAWFTCVSNRLLRSGT